MTELIAGEPVAAEYLLGKVAPEVTVLGSSQVQSSSTVHRPPAASVVLMDSDTLPLYGDLGATTQAELQASMRAFWYYLISK